MRRFLALAIAVAPALGAPFAASAAPPPPADTASLAYGAEFFAPKQPVTAYDMVLLVPGFTFEEGEQVRGYAGSAGNVLIDGRRPSSKLDLLADLLRRIPAARVARIEVIRGGAPGIDMQGHAVLANVVLKPSAAGQVVATASALIYGDGHTGEDLRLDWSRRDGERAADASLLVFKHQNPNSGDGRRTLRDADGSLASDARARITEPTDAVMARGAYQRPTLGGLMRLKAAFTYGADHLAEEDHIEAGPMAPDDTFRTSVFRTRQAELSLDFNRPLPGRGKLELVALQTFERAEDVGNAFADGGVSRTRADADQGESIGRARLEFAALAGLTLSAGGEYDFNFLNGRERLSANGVAIPLPSADVRVTEGRAEAFAMTSWKPRARLEVEAGVRLETSRLRVTGDVHNETSFVFLKPRAVITWSPVGEEELRLRIERTVSQLDFQDFASVSSFDTNTTQAGNPTLQPERDWIVETAIEHHFWSSGAVTLTLSHAWLDRVIDDVPFEGFSSRGNIGSGRREAAALDLTLPLARLGLKGGQLKADGTWKASRVTDPTTGARRQVSLDQPFSGSAALTNDVPRLKSSWRIDVSDGYRYANFLIDEDQRFRFETQVSALWEFKPSSDLVVQAQVQNLTGARRLRERRLFDGLRSAGSLHQVEALAIRNRPRLMLGVRRSF